MMMASRTRVFILIFLATSSTFTAALNNNNMKASSTAAKMTTIRIAEDTWRQAATQHQRRIRTLLEPGLTSSTHQMKEEPQWTALDPKNPVFNFLIEYYGLKGAKGPRRIARWSPNPAVLLKHQQPGAAANGILLEGATENDLGSVLHLRGASIDPDQNGIVYSPATFFGKGDHSRTSEAQRASTPFLWYRSILQQTMSAEPITHCYGLHEWAMLFHPHGAPPPPSAQYQRHLPLRVTREVINATVERKGIRCTHVDALRFFAPAAGPLNHHGARLERQDQLRLEQPACVHAHMDLLKMALKLQPFVDPQLLQAILDIALQARRLDVAASPYDASEFGVEIVPIEKADGRAEYRRKQVELMKATEPVRRELLEAYNCVLELGFDEAVIQEAERSPMAERNAQAEPGSLPWRKNLLSANTAS